MVSVHFIFIYFESQHLYFCIVSSAIEAFSAHNDSLDYLRGISGFSYMCRSTQTLEVSQDFSLNTYLLHVQPFGLTEDQFGPGKFLCPHLFHRRVL